MFKNNQTGSLGLSLSIGIVLALFAGFNSSTFAQVDDQGYQSNEKDSLYGDAPGGLNPLDLIHRSQQLGGRSAAEFEEESRGQINNSASDFKRLQQERLFEQQQSETSSPEAVETVNEF